MFPISVKITETKIPIERPKIQKLSMLWTESQYYNVTYCTYGKSYSSTLLLFWVIFLLNISVYFISSSFRVWVSLLPLHRGMFCSKIKQKEMFSSNCDLKSMNCLELTAIQQQKLKFKIFLNIFWFQIYFVG